MEAADEIGLAVVATTGDHRRGVPAGRLHARHPRPVLQSFAIATCVSVAFSLLVARMLTPLMGAFPDPGGGPTGRHAGLGTGLSLVLRMALRWRWITLALGRRVLRRVDGSGADAPPDFMPASDRGRSLISVELPPGATLDRDRRGGAEHPERLKGEPEVAEDLRLHRDADFRRDGAARRPPPGKCARPR